MQPIGQSVFRPKLVEQAHDVVAAVPPARRALDAQHDELADQSADRSVAGHVGSLAKGRATGQSAQHWSPT